MHYTSTDKGTAIKCTKVRAYGRFSVAMFGPMHIQDKTPLPEPKRTNDDADGLCGQVRE